MLVFFYLHISAFMFGISVCNCIPLQCTCSPEMTRRKTNTQIKQNQKINKEDNTETHSEALVPNAQKLLSSSLMICLIIHAAHLRVTQRNMRNDEYSSSSTVTVVLGGIKRQTNKKKILK